MFCALLGQIAGEGLQDHWSSGLNFKIARILAILIFL